MVIRNGDTLFNCILLCSASNITPSPQEERLATTLRYQELSNTTLLQNVEHQFSAVQLRKLQNKKNILTFQKLRCVIRIMQYCEMPICRAHRINSTISTRRLEFVFSGNWKTNKSLRSIHRFLMFHLRPRSINELLHDYVGLGFPKIVTVSVSTPGVSKNIIADQRDS